VAGADVRHGAEVEIEVADIGAVRIDISLLADHDVVDQARSPGVVAAMVGASTVVKPPTSLPRILGYGCNPTGPYRNRFVFLQP
jgi:hypothetical protein